MKLLSPRKTDGNQAESSSRSPKSRSIQEKGKINVEDLSKASPEEINRCFEILLVLFFFLNFKMEVV
jgi:hypothetical protein